MNTLDSAVVICRKVWDCVEQFGYHCALTGSCLRKGASEKDVDIVLYSNTPLLRTSPEELAKGLEQIGIIGLRPVTKRDYPIPRDIWTGYFEGIRIDFFIMKEDLTSYTRHMLDTATTRHGVQLDI